MRSVFLALLGLSIMAGGLFGSNRALAGGKSDLVFIGTYTDKAGSKGIYKAEFDPTTGKLSTPVLAIESTDPSFLTIHPNGRWLYAVNELFVFEGKKSGAVTAFSLDRETGKLKQLNQKPSGGPLPCHIVVDPSGQRVALANYNGGGDEKGPYTDNFAIFAIGDDGALAGSKARQFGGKSIKPRQQATHPHSVNFTPKGDYLLIADLGLDKVFAYPFAKGELAGRPISFSLAAGAGPRHLDISAKGDRFYVVNELNSTVSVFDFNSTTPKQSITTLPKDADASKNGPAEIRIHHELGYVYASNRGHDSIAIFKINPADGTLTAVGHQQHEGIKTPRGFTLHKNYLLAGGQTANKAVVFRIDPKTGMLQENQVVDVPAPVCFRVLSR